MRWRTCVMIYNRTSVALWPVLAGRFFIHCLSFGISVLLFLHCKEKNAKMLFIINFHYNILGDLIVVKMQHSQRMLCVPVSQLFEMCYLDIISKIRIWYPFVLKILSKHSIHHILQNWENILCFAVWKHIKDTDCLLDKLLCAELECKTQPYFW